MENILSLVTINNYDTNIMPSLTNFSFRVCDVSLPQDNTGYVCFHISIRTNDYIYIGECNNIISRINQHKSGYGSNSTTPYHRHLFAIMSFICGFNGNKSMRQMIKNCGNKNEIFLSTKEFKTQKFGLSQANMSYQN